MALRIEGLGLLQHGPTIELHVAAGKSVCVVGPAGSGKSKLLRVLGGAEPPDRGKVTTPTKVAWPQEANPKLRPQDLSHRKGANQAAASTDVLSQLGLWDVRQQTIAELNRPQIAACELLPVFLAAASLAIIDGHFDRLDPWMRMGALHLLTVRCGMGAVFVVATNNLALAEHFDYLVVMRDHQPVFSGSVPELVANKGQRALVIESEHNRGVRALVEPMGVAVSRTESGYRLEPGPGQEHAAKLLRDGYGDVRFAVSDERPLAEIIAKLL